jgi:hypothetical protein
MIIKAIIIIAALYFAICALLYFFQENLIFYPQKLDKNYRFTFAR